MPAKHDAATDAARRKYNAEKMRTFAASIPKAEGEAFRAACAAEGSTVNAVLRRLMREYAAAAAKEGEQQ